MSNLGISVKADVKAVSKKLKSLDKKVVVPAANSAINKTMRTVQKETVSVIKSETAIPSRRVKEKLKLIKSTFRTLTAKLQAPRRPLQNLIEWVPKSKQNPVAFRKKTGVVSRAWGKAKTYQGSFIGYGKNSGKALVFARRGPTGKAKLKALAGPSVRGTFIKQKAQGVADRIAKVEFRKNFNRELRFRLNRL